MAAVLCPWLHVCCAAAGCTLCALNEVEAAKKEFAAALAIMPRHLEVNDLNFQAPVGE